MSTLLTPRKFLAVHQVTIDPDGARNLFVRILTRTSGLLFKKLNAGEAHHPLLPFLESAQLQLPNSYQAYQLVWGTGAGTNPTTYVLRHDSRDEGVTNDYLIGPDHELLWGWDGGPDFIDHTTAAVHRDQVDLIGVYPNLMTSAKLADLDLQP
jgi:hypothetical protein